VHQAADGEVGHQESVEFLAYQIGRFAARHDPCVAQVGLEFVERGFYLPTLVIERCQVAG